MKNLKIKYKIAISSILLIVVFGIILTTIQLFRDYNSGIENYKITGVAIIKNIELHTAEHMYVNDIVALQRMVNDVKESDSDISYVFVLNQENKVLVHTFKDGFPSDLLTINNKAEQNILLLDTGNESIYDFSYPIVRGKLGILRIGLSRNRLIKNLKQNLFITLLLLFSFVMLGIFVSIYVSRIITNSLMQLVDSVDKISKGNFKQKLIINSNDEIGLLAASFNKMCISLQNMTNELDDKILLLNTKNNEYAALNEELMTSEEEIRAVNEELVVTSDALKESDDRQREILNSFINGIYINSSDYIIEYLNSPMIKMIGGDKTGQKCYKAIYNRDKACDWCGNEKLKKGEIFTYEIKHPITNKYYTLKKTLLDSGLTVTTYHDISKLKEKEFQLIEQNAELIIAKEKAEESDRLKTEFLHNMSHEVRTPMNGIIGFSNFISEPDLSNEIRNHYINIIQNSSAQLLRIIDDILEVSMLGTKQVELHNDEVCLNDLLSEQFSIFDIKAKENKIPLFLKKELSDIDSTIITDKTKLDKVLSNLLENSLKFTKSGFIEFGYTLKRDSEPVLVEIYVKDTGVGIKQENHKRIFDRFSQEEKNMSRKFGGLGLGLTIARENAELLGGEIRVESKKGEGATFFVTIPFKFVQPDSVALIQKAEIAKKKKIYTILVVEDEEVNFLYLKTLISDKIDLNCNILFAKNGKEAVDLCKVNSNIDLILMDIKMQIMNGYEATKLIKEFCANVPIVAQTAYSTLEDKNKALQFGFNDFISKPISLKVFKEVIEKYLKL